MSKVYCVKLSKALMFLTALIKHTLMTNGLSHLKMLHTLVEARLGEYAIWVVLTTVLVAHSFKSDVLVFYCLVLSSNNHLFPSLLPSCQWHLNFIFFYKIKSLQCSSAIRSAAVADLLSVSVSIFLTKGQISHFTIGGYNKTKICQDQFLGVEGGRQRCHQKYLLAQNKL